MQCDEDYAYETQRQRRIDEEDKMDIDYKAIIEKANKRKDILMEITDRLQSAPAKYDELQDIIQWLAELTALFKDLDGEGRTMLPAPVRYTLENGLNTGSFLESAKTRQWNGVGIGIKELAAHV